VSSASTRARKVLHRAPRFAALQFHEITGAVFDSLAQIALVRVAGWNPAGDYLRQAG
jgi:hypothetical protein